MILFDAKPAFSVLISPCSCLLVQLLIFESSNILKGYLSYGLLYVEYLCLLVTDMIEGVKRA
uniref:Uncharacterized protein n=1 Tax=Solanum lycopersicum TaxID=4081 RepID=A0A3Q7HMX6_SOLLC